MDNKILLWLDDARNPHDDGWLPLWSPVKDYEKVVWLESYSEFKEYITINGLPYAICFDHDLGEDGTGFDAAKWLVGYCQDRDIPLPEWRIQSANPIGSKNISSLLTNYTKHYVKTHKHDNRTKTKATSSRDDI